MKIAVHVIVLTICASVWVPVRLGPPGDVAGEEPSDAEVFEAVVSSMRRYYERRGHTKRPQSLVRRKRDEEMVCYSELGCFRDEGPFDYLDTLPQAPEIIGTQFLLYTRANPEAHLLLHYANISSLYTPLFNRSHPVKVMVHGFGSSCQKQWAVEMRSALFQLSNVNVICVNWEEGASLPNYVQAAANTRLVGKQLAKFIRVLNGVRGTNNTAFHLIGFSLGAHVAGFAGDEARNLSRITGLDPAAPLFEGYSPKARLDPSDALFVDVIHSNGESLLYGGLGAFEPMGHVDYYPNGGKEQGGCSNIFVGAISDLIWYQSKKEGGRSLCNHRRAYKFFADSIVKACHFPAFACSDFRSFLQGDCFDCSSGCANMGYYADRSAPRGKFYLLTRDDEPFCANQFKVVIESSMGLSPTYGALELTLINWNMRNETFQLSQEGEQLLPGRPLTTVIVAHPFMNNPVSAQIRYMPYKGWMTNGLERWAVDKITVISSAGQKYSFCHRGLPLAEGKPASVLLSPKHCSQDTPPPSFRPLKMKPVSLDDDDDEEESNVIPTSGPRNLSKPYVTSKIIYGKKAHHQGGPPSVYAPGPPSPQQQQQQQLQQQQELSSRAGHERTLVRPWRPYHHPIHYSQPHQPPPVRRSGSSSSSSFTFRSAKTFPHQEERHFRLVQWVPEARAQIVFIPKRIEEHFIPLRHEGLPVQQNGRRLKDVLKRFELPELQI